jgi:EmrB/QacA subfamily drug resistance transporter
LSSLDQRAKQLTLLACILGSSIVFVDSTIVNIALPALRRDFNAGLSAQQWVVDAYLLTLGGLLLLGGSLGDLLGRRRVFVAGVGGFGITSLLCALAPNVPLLVVGRALQGVAGALLVPSTLAIIVAVFDEDERGKAIGAWTAWTGAATVVGPLAGGLLVDSASWRWIFAVNVPVVVVTIALILRVVPELGARARHVHIDFIGAALCGLGLGGLVFALIEQPTLGFSDPGVLVPLATGAALLVAFPLYERRTPEPMLPLGLFSARNFAVGNLATLGIYAGLSALFFLVVIFLQGVAGYSALEAGLATTPVTVIMFFLSRRFGALADRFGPHLFMAGGPLVAAAGLLLFLRVGPDPAYLGELLPALVVFGVGLAMTVAPLTATVLAGADQEHAGVASGVNNAIARVAGLIGIALIGTVVSAQFTATVDHRLAAVPLDPRSRAAVLDAESRPLARAPLGSVPQGQRAAVADVVRDASVSGFRVGIGLAAGLIAAGGMISMVGIRNPRRKVKAQQCPGGALCGASQEAAYAVHLRQEGAIA